MIIVYFSPIAYDELKQRPQYIAEGLSEKHHVYYVEPTIRLTSCLLGHGKEYKGRKYNINPNLEVIRCDGTLVLPFRWNVYDYLSLNGLAERVYLKKVVEQADLLIVGFEGWMNVLTWVKDKKIIYDKMDDNVQLSLSNEVKCYLKRCEEKLLNKVTGMFVTAEKFYHDYQKRIKNVHLIPNGVNLECDNLVSEPKRENKKVYGYVGMIADWFDMEVIKEISKIDDSQIVLVGPCNIEPFEAENVRYTGKVPKTQVAEMIQSFDVCLYPFKKTELLDTINPVKIYEYLALNKPVIAVDSLEMRKFGKLVYRYEGIEDLWDLCNSELDKPFCNETECMKFVDANSWNNRVKQILRIVEDL